MKLIFVRHGLTEENSKGILQGQLPGTLSEEGRMQARKAGEFLKDEKIDKIIVSKLKRTMETANEIIKFHPEAEIVYDSRVLDRHRGIYEGKQKTIYWDAFKKSGQNLFEYVPKGGESIKQLNDRVIEFLNELILNEKEKTILVVSHGGVITKALLYLLKKPDIEYDDFHPKNTAISILDITGDKVVPVVINQLSHIQP